MKELIIIWEAIKGGNSSALLLDNVTLNPLLDVTDKSVTTVVTTDENGTKKKLQLPKKVSTDMMMLIIN